MNIDAAVIGAASLLLTAGGGVIGNLLASRWAVRKDEVTLLRDEVVRISLRVKSLEEDNDALRRRNRLLEEYIDMLRALLRQNNIPLPPTELYK